MLPPVVCHLFSHTFTSSSPLVEKLSSPVVLCGSSAVFAGVPMWFTCARPPFFLWEYKTGGIHKDQVYVEFCGFWAPWKGGSSGPSVVVGLMTNLFYESKWKSLFKSDERKRMCPWQTPNELLITDGKNQNGDTLSRFFLTKYRQKDDTTVSHFYNINSEVCVSLCSPDLFCHIPRMCPHQRPTHLQRFHKETFANNFVWMILWLFIKSDYYQMR